MIKSVFTFKFKFYEYIGVLLLAVAGNFCYNLYHTIDSNVSIWGLPIYLTFNLVLTIIYSLSGISLLYYSYELELVNKDFSKADPKTDEKTWIFNNLGRDKSFLVLSLLLFITTFFLEKDSQIDQKNISENQTPLQSIDYYPGNLPLIYDLFADKNKNYTQQYDLICSLIDTTKAKSFYILDAACGTGDVVVKLQESFPNFSIYGSDGDSNMIKYARSKWGIRGANIVEHPILWQNIIKNSFLVNKSWDYILVLGNSIPFLRNESDLNTVIQNFYNILKPGGMLIIDYRDLITMKDYKVLGNIKYNNIDCILTESFKERESTIEHIFNIWNQNKLVWTNEKNPFLYNKNFMDKSYMSNIFKNNLFELVKHDNHGYKNNLIIGKKTDATKR